MAQGDKQVRNRIKTVFLRQLDHVMNDMSLKRKLILMYLLCVLLPIFLTDGFILSIIIRAERSAKQQEIQNISEAIKYSLETRVEDAVHLVRNIYGNRYVNEFVEKEDSTPLEYYNNYLMLMRDSLYETGVKSGSFCAVIYADNPTIVNGGYFQRIEKALDEEWYQAILESGLDVILYPYYDNALGIQTQKRLSVIQKMDYYNKGKSKNVLKVDLDYSAIIQSIVNSHYPAEVYVCTEDKILFSNDGRGGIGMPFEPMREDIIKKAGSARKMNLYGQSWTVYVMDVPVTTVQLIKEHYLLIFALLFLNILVPVLFMQGFRRSFVLRLQVLGKVFDEQESEQLQPLPEAMGEDEIGILMRSYNHMAERINELIETVYKEKLREQEMDIARQKAELLALHSQINPHFLFNALESIRMHSVIKKEYETAEMVERLALMQRQNVVWGSDAVQISEEIRFAEAYLELQKYRFGERLSYKIDIEKDCESITIPRLTLVTFVENACVHGIEGKMTPGWIFVRGSRDNEELRLEIEDTGVGMPAGQVYELQEKMNHVHIGQLKENGRVGILNACLRLRMTMGDAVRFQLESEENAGTIVTIRLRLP